MRMNYNAIKNLITRYPILTEIEDELYRAGDMLIEAIENNGKLLICGNGGSASDADHIVGELMKSFIKPRPISIELKNSLCNVAPEYGEKMSAKLQAGIPAISLTKQDALATAFSNDVDPYLGFAQQVSILGYSGDVYWGLSTSGNSKNVVYGAVAAKAKGLKVLGMTGANGGELKKFCDHCICVPETETYIIQELHLPVYHALCIFIEETFWK